MSGGRSTLNIEAPEDMYTMSEQRVVHVLQPHEWVLIKKGSGNELREWMIGLAGGAFGFVQNAFNVGRWIYERGAGVISAQVAVWDVVGSIIFIALVTGSLCLFLVCRKMKSDFDSVVKDIDCRKPQPFAAGKAL